MKRILTLLIAGMLAGSVAWANNAVPSDYGSDQYFAPSLSDTEAQADVIEKSQQNTVAGKVILKADKAQYDQESGNFFAEGHVVITQAGTVLKTEYAEGNMKDGNVYLKNGGNLLEQGSDIHAEWAHYNFLDKTGQVKGIDGGNVGKQEWYKAEGAEIKDGKVICRNGATISKCPAKKHPPCLSVVSQYFEFIPNDRIIAKRCDVYVKGVKIYHCRRWENDLTSEHKFMIHPHIGYDNNNGVNVKLGYDQRVWDGGVLSLNFVYYSREDFKPSFGVKQSTRDFTINWSDGWHEDDDDWYKKENNWEFNWKRHRLIKGLPLTYSAFVEHGLWKRQYGHGQCGPKSWHSEYGVYLYHDPIHLFDSKKNSLNLYVGKKYTRDLYSAVKHEYSTNSSNLYGATLTQQLGRDWRVWVGYYDQKTFSDRPFDIGQPDMARELRPGLQYTTPDRKNTFSWVYRLNTQNGKYGAYRYGHRYEYDLTWQHRFCCWNFEVTYRREYAERDHEIDFRYNFDFT